ncbi:MAG: substrate-binding domain-containing protein [Candidatus Bathyarchaeota archaeon]|nr:substrate-binding domain-containing protein [Candidatus Bathyarchaeota archaeon]MCX8177097.1 substrate-binding domain-containing protein [Candidatus Bathyarchaeota archaeon]MDW8193732.1 substrate-binding domain-containing protein [Nitrososphaerota archaeon]
MEAWVKMLTAAVAITLLLIAVNALHMRSSGRLIVATTTSLHDAGLLDAVERAYESQTHVDLIFIPAGTGQAVENAKRGDVDLVLVHSPELEKILLEGGFGVSRKIFAYNFFAIIGPEADPAGLRGLNATQALKRIAAYGDSKPFKVWISRGDNSGTYVREKNLWVQAGFNYDEIALKPWYDSAGAGMGAVIMKAEEFSAYTLVDMGTYLKYALDGRTSLKVLVTETRELLNVYSAIAVNPACRGEANYEAAIAFISFLVSEKGQQLIENYGRSIYGRSLFKGAVKLLRESPESQIAMWIREQAYINGYECPPEYRGPGHPELYG